MKTRYYLIASVLLLFGFETARAQFTGGPGRGDNMARLGVITSIETEAENPLAIELRQNYPNPFNPTTLISYILPDAAHVQLGVYNLTGQRVALLVNGELAAGEHSVSFDANRLASGTYIYRLQAGNFVQTRKMMLVQ